MLILFHGAYLVHITNQIKLSCSYEDSHFYRDPIYSQFVLFKASVNLTGEHNITNTPQSAGQSV